MDEATLSFWREVCLGDLTVTDVNGNHFSCMDEPHVAQLAAHIAQPLDAAPAPRGSIKLTEVRREVLVLRETLGVEGGGRPSRWAVAAAC